MAVFDDLITSVDKMLRAVAGVSHASRVNPSAKLTDDLLTEAERKHSAGLMRVNHVGEVCAQALYDSQGRFAQGDVLKRQFAQAGREEEDHLAWTAERLKELGSRPSLLNPFWYGGAYLLGTLAARMGNANSLGFVVETERQVEAHLASHLDKLPANDIKSRSIVKQMRDDEIEHGDRASQMGANDLPAPVKKMMKITAKLMTTTAYYL